MSEARVTNTASSLRPRSRSTLDRTAESSVPRCLKTNRTTVLSSAYAFTTGAGSPGPATNSPTGAVAASGEPAAGEVVAPAGLGSVEAPVLSAGAAVARAPEVVGEVAGEP